MKLPWPILPLILAAGLPLIASSPWTPKQRAAEISFGVLLAADCLQTLDIRHHPGMYETNPVMGRHPSDLETVGYFAAAGLLQFWLTDSLPPWGRNLTLGVSNGLEAGVVAHNFSIGLKLKF
jgi:hypothetical protein